MSNVEEKLSNNKKIEERAQTNRETTQDGSNSSTLEPVVVIECLSSTHAQSSGSENGKEALETDQPNKGNPLSIYGNQEEVCKN